MSDLPVADTSTAAAAPMVEQRSRPRHCCGTITLTRLSLAAVERTHFAWVHDISEEGIGLDVLGPLAVGADLVFEMRGSGQDAKKIRLYARVVHATPTGTFYRLGCRFTPPAAPGGAGGNTAARAGGSMNRMPKILGSPLALQPAHERAKASSGLSHGHGRRRVRVVVDKACSDSAELRGRHWRGRWQCGPGRGHHSACASISSSTRLRLAFVSGLAWASRMFPAAFCSGVK